MNIQLQADAMLIKAKGLLVSIAEHEGKMEVAVQGAEHSVRVLNDEDGLHVGKKKPVKE